MPPARAATEGMAGASSASANTRLYARPSVVLPKTDTIAYATRLPRPDLMKPPDSQKAMAMSHLREHKQAHVTVHPVEVTRLSIVENELMAFATNEKVYI